MSSLKIFPANCGQVVVAPISNEELERGATEEELLSVKDITSPHRRRERLAWRALLRELEPAAQIEYLESGRPILNNSQYKHISVSHSRDYVAVALSSEPCGVDVESLDRNFERVKARFLSVEEASLCENEHWVAVVWSAKEAMYKMAGREGVDFLHDIQVKGLFLDDNGSSWRLQAQLFGEQLVQLRAEVLDDNHILVFTL